MQIQHKTAYQFSFRYHNQKFTQPVITNHGIWETRESIIICLMDINHQIAWGEIAPISWFGSETIEQALEFCQQLPGKITDEIIFTIPDHLPSCQFGFESGYENLMHQNPTITNLTYSGLLSAGEKALNQWQTLWEQGYQTFKWKIGVDDIAKELKIFNSLIHDLPNSAKLRLDANGGLNYETTKLWLQTCDQLQTKIEFIEQPLPINQFHEILKLSKSYSTKIALDESVATLQQLKNCYQQGWRGIFVIKPGIVGSPSQLRKFCQQNQIDKVFSSVFETEIGRQASLKLAAELSLNHRAVGFGVNHFFTQQQNWLQTLWNNL
ncbi:o-succinylbenzoate synthase [Cronbergia sp. UHCC 0137]|uniref:o-succinylbenzoate synthase n=1 Tax=Cronbergia sp. UHCC 0137 TaxID=3110239 RepID=UPI002B2096D2|nr:o-succinylbenzoate synthase [Cronbergia sp. UHCC 0137]MEA5618661.1 o-succinylbenzoate synthase [Cronbergia sp. UHCC 0137]